MNKLEALKSMEANNVPSPRSVIFDDPRSPGLPEWVLQLRAAQWEVAVEIVEAFNRGKKVVILDAPTGSGKTLVAELVRRMLSTKAIYSCSTKTLQDQFEHDFPYCKVIKGRENYPTLDHPERFNDPNPNIRITAADCVHTKETLPACPACLEHGYMSDDGFHFDGVSGNGVSANEEVKHCPWCHPAWLSPYEVAKKAATESRLAVMNTAYFLSEVNNVGQFDNWPLVIFDEADLLESQLMNSIEVSIAPRRRRDLRIQRPYIRTMGAAKFVESWVGWSKQTQAIIKERMNRISPVSPTDVMKIREHKYLNGMVDKLERLIKEIPDSGWVYTGYEANTKGDEDNYSDPVVFKPIFVHSQAGDLLWKHGERFLLMSATMLSGEQVAAELGIPEGVWHMVNMPSSFPKENRPIFVAPKADMTNKLKDQERPKLAKGIDEILERYPNDRVLIHTVSYDLARYIMQTSRNTDRMMTYISSKERDDMLEHFRQTPGAVMVAPSFDRGVDLRDDDCRVVIVAKVPYPYLGDKQISARIYSPGGNEWYHMQTIRSIIQMTGRGVRHEKDWADTFIVDEQFLNLWRKRRHWFPNWWKEAIVWADRVYGKAASHISNT